MNPILFYILSAVLSGLVLFGLSMQSKVKSAVSGNLVCVGVMCFAILLTLVNANAVFNWKLWASMAVGADCCTAERYWRTGERARRIN